MELRRIACCGKLPSAGDYVRSGLDAPWQRALFDWLVEGWGRSLASGTVRDLSGVVHVLATLPAAGCRASMLLCPSRDRVNRRFPFVVMAELHSNDTSWGEALVLLAPHWLDAGPIGDLAARGLDVNTIRAQVEALNRDRPLPDLQRHRDWRRQAGLGELRAPNSNCDLRAWLRAVEFARSTPTVPEFIVRGECAGGVDELAATVDVTLALGKHPARTLAIDLPLQTAARWRLGCAELHPRFLRPLVWHEAASELAWDLEKELPNVPAGFAAPGTDSLALTSTTVQGLLEGTARG